MLAIHKILIVAFGLLSVSGADVEDLPAVARQSTRSKYHGRNLGFITRNVCRGVRAANPGSTCTCTGNRLLLNRNRPLTVQCVNSNGWIIPFIGTFTTKYNGEFYLFNDAKLSTSKLCLSEKNNRYDVACLAGVHCEGDFNCYSSCSATVGTRSCNSCNVCPDKTGAIVDCTNLIPLLKWSDCEGQDPAAFPMAGLLSAPAAAPV
jgi:hypothetical protein